MVFKNISIDEKVCHGKPVIKGTRVLVSNILASLAEGLSIEEIIKDYPNITEDDIKSCLNFASYLSNYENYSYDSVAS